MLQLQQTIQFNNTMQLDQIIKCFTCTYWKTDFTLQHTQSHSCPV